jgi:hypothetical protein
MESRGDYRSQGYGANRHYSLHLLQAGKRIRAKTPGRRKSAARSPCYSKVNVSATGDKRKESQGKAHQSALVRL